MDFQTLDGLASCAVSDRDLVAALRAGDRLAAGQVYDIYGTRLYAYCHELLADPKLSADALRDTFIVAVNRVRGLADPEEFGAWLYALARNECVRVGVSDDAALQSARECLEKLRGKFGPNFRATYGDHELGKMSLLGKRGGIRLASFWRARDDLKLEPLWRVELGNNVLLGVTSSLVALPLFEPDMLPEEQVACRELSAEHLARIREALTALKPKQRVVLFCHDPSALPFLWREINT